MRIYVYIVLLFLCIGSTYAQDPHYSHFYAIPLQLGPSFAGATGGTRAALNFRDQWTAVKQEYFTFSIMADHYFTGTHNGAGIVLYRDQAGAGKLATSVATLQYAYSLNATKNIAFRPGLQVAFAQRSIDYSDIVFGDQLSFQGDRDFTSEPSLYESVNYMDFGASLLTVISNYWVGFTLDHIIQPNQSLLHEESLVPQRLSVYGGAKFSYKPPSQKKRRQRENIYVMLHYNEQNNAKQGYLGSYWEHNYGILGVWYRGIPFADAYDAYMNTDALIFMLGFKKSIFTCIYSYDFTISKLVSNTAGSHEITLSWNWQNSNTEKQKKKRMHVVPCPMSDGPKTQYHQQRSL